MRKQPTGEPDAGDPHVRFGGEGASAPLPNRIVDGAARQRRSGPSHSAAPRLSWRRGVVEPPTGVLPGSAPWWETGPGCMRARNRAGEERVRGQLVLYPRSETSVRRDAAPRYCRGMARRRRLRAAPPADDLKIDSTHCGGTHVGGTDCGGTYGGGTYGGGNCAA